MGIKLVDTLPKCDFCGEDAAYDAPTIHGSWANMCFKCSLEKGGNVSIGTHFQKRVPTDKKPIKETILGIESKDISYWEDVLMDVINREIECPTCGEIREVEPDATYLFTCNGCGQNIQTPQPIL